MSAIQIPCPSCGQKLSFEAEALRMRMACPRCTNSFVPIDSLPHDQPLPAIAVTGAQEVKAPEKAPAAVPNRVVKTVLMMPGDASSAPVAGATSPAKAAPPNDKMPSAPVPGVLPPLAPAPVLDNARTFIKAPPKDAPIPPPPPPLDDVPAAVPTISQESAKESTEVPAISQESAAATPEETKAPSAAPEEAP
ncbi:MAG TPA: hypothetical protein PK156_44465, partial [Polyangium sp.]|nr:hypothetical protein [Polyangium sp.]